MDDCAFCNIVSRGMSADIVFENDRIIVIKDILPKAPVHLLIIPKQHIESVTSIAEADQSLLGELILVAKQVAEKQGISSDGYKLIFNVGKHGGQVIQHLHMHLLGGKQLGE